MRLTAFSRLRTVPALRSGSAAFALALAGAFACASPPPPAEAPPASEPPGPMPDAQAESMSDEPAPAEKKKKFDDMDPGERMQLMKTVVMPTMKKAFQEFDAKEFADFSCATCHGPGAKEGKFDMPTASLPALDKEEIEEHPEMTKFMSEKVVPQMAEILGEEPYDHETGQGEFGCMNCHTEKK